MDGIMSIITQLNVKVMSARSTRTNDVVSGHNGNGAALYGERKGHYVGNGCARQKICQKTKREREINSL